MSIVHDDHRSLVHDTITDCIKRKAPFEIEYRIRHADGDVRWLREHGRGVLNADGSLSYVAGVISDITEQKRAQDTVRESEERFRTMVSNIPGVSYRTRVDDDRSILFVSDAIKILTGYGPEEFSEIAGREGITAPDLAHPEDRAMVRAEILAALDQGRSFTIEYRMIRKDGRVIWVQDTGRAVSFSDDDVPWVDGVVTEITERKIAEQALRESEERYQESAQRAHLGHYVWDTATGKLNFCSEEYARIYGLPMADILIAHSSSEGELALIHPDDRERYYEQVFALAITEIRPIDIEYRIIRPDGEVRHIHEIGEPQCDNDGRLIRVTGTIQDITERVQSERALRKCEEHLARAQKIAGMGSWVCDLVTGELRYSTGLDEIYGRPHSSTNYSEALAEFLEWVHPDDRELVNRRMRNSLERGEPYVMEYRLLTPGSDEKTIFEQCEVERDATGRPIRLLGTIQDITERKKTEEQLRQAQKMETVGQLTGGVAHDFNNLLGIMLGNTELLMSRLSEDTGALGHLQAIERAAHRGGELTHGLLAFSRRQVRQPRSVDLNELVESVTGILRRALGETIAIQTSLAHALPATEIDPGQLENALLNLAINARDAMPGGGVLSIETSQIHLDAQADEQTDAPPGDYVALTVTDTGTGMTPEVLEKVFDPFFTTKEVGKGSGLGLSMVYGFVKQSNGHVTIESEEGRGTTIRLTFSTSETTVVADDTPARDRLPEGPGETVLIVEDDPDLRDLTREMIESLGYNTLTAEDGTSALVAFANSPEIALVLCDVVLPGTMDGPSIVAEMKARRPDIRALLMSGYAGTHLDSKMTGAADTLPLLSKPFDRRTLARSLRNALDE